MSDTKGARALPADADAAENTRNISPRDRVIRDVLRGIYDGSFEPGERLTEAKLTAQYGVSRGPVREALNRLAANGVVELAPQRGAQIRIMTLSEAIDSLIVAQSLVGTAARLAAENAQSAEEKKALTETVAKLLQFDQSSQSVEYANARDAFYSILTRLADNAALSHAMVQIHIHLIRAQFRIVLRTVDRRRHRDYTDIAAAIVEGDPRKAERMARAHIGRAINALRAHKAKDGAG